MDEKKKEIVKRVERVVEKMSREQLILLDGFSMGIEIMEKKSEAEEEKSA